VITRFSIAEQWVTVALICAAAPACNERVESGVKVADEARRLQRATTPPKANIIAREPPERTPMRVVHEWTVATALAWSDYLEAVTPALSESYVCAASGPDRVACSRSLPGDRFLLELLSRSSSDGPRVVARFEARPD
jgi:hypothetical protein